MVERCEWTSVVWLTRIPIWILMIAVTLQGDRLLGSRTGKPFDREDADNRFGDVE